MMNNKHLEVEVKFLVDDLPALRETLLTQGAQVVKSRVFERNLRLDSAEEGLLQQQYLLRLRQDSANKLTFKGPSAEQAHSEAKVREELEIEVSDFDTTLLIFQRLGYEPVQVYEKYRETFELGELEIVLDEMPFGDFVELEGPESAIRASAERLGLDWQKRLLTNYLALMEAMRDHHNLPFRDLTFDNFADSDLHVGDILNG